MQLFNVGKRSRFFVHNAITDFASAILVLYGDTKEHGNEEALLFPSSRTAKTCVDFVNYFSGIAAKGEEGNGKNVVRILELATRPRTPWTTVFAVVYPARDEARAAAKAFWQHVGEGLSTRQTATCRQLFNQGLLVLVTENDGDGIFSQAKAVDSVDQLQCQDATTDVDASKEKLQIRQRIAALVEHDTTPEITAKDVYLYPSGMSALFNIHRTILGTLGRKDCICFGFEEAL
jgi:cystathionine gamma-synthase